jgi:hypothetical protein
LSENLHLPFDILTPLSKAEGLRYPHPRPVEFSLCETAQPIQQGKSLRRTSAYVSFLGICPRCA